MPNYKYINELKAQLEEAKESMAQKHEEVHDTIDKLIQVQREHLEAVELVKNIERRIKEVDI